MKFLLTVAAIFMLAGCAAKIDRARDHAFQSSPPSCSTQNDEIDCQWLNVPAS